MWNKKGTMKTKVTIVVHQGCVISAYSNDKNIDLQVLDLDGDYADEGKRKVAKLEKSKAFEQVWP